ncbi:hypothetical protein BJV82DRAFT_656052 [Fennellomyces sp. T-0311]|nr:hypothetical protein BJV82DRAFT_656052 [Fennellomyces sp. T-0311]
MMVISKDLEGKVAVITGGSRGIGKAVATELVARGVRVVIGNLSQENGEDTVRELNDRAGSKVAAFVRTDVALYADNIALFKYAEKLFGGVDIAFLNAGIAGAASDIIFTAFDDAYDEHLMNVNAMGVIKGSHPLQSMAIYSASKYAVNGWTRSLNWLRKVCNVRVNAVSPSYLDTDLVADLSELYDSSKPLAEFLPKTPKVSMDTVVRAVLMLIEDEERNGNSYAQSMCNIECLISEYLAAQTLLALPGDVIRVEDPPAPLMEGVTPEYEETCRKYEDDYVPFYKKLLERTCI